MGSSSDGVKCRLAIIGRAQEEGDDGNAETARIEQ